jgi:hypothetical protein
MIHDSPSHLYHSALKFPPSSSWLHQYYSAGLSKEVKVIRGLSAGWGKCFRTVLLDGCPAVLACWKDTIAVGLQHGDIITLNAVTGSKIGVLSGHTNQVNSLTFSQMGYHLYLGVEIKPSSSGICRLVGLLKPSMAMIGELILFPSQWTVPQLLQGPRIRQFACGIFRQGSVIVL